MSAPADPAALPLILLPGMMCDARLFGPQIAALSARRDLILPTLTGADSVNRLAEAVLRLAPPRFALLGLSMGGIVAMEVLRLAPDRVERLALLDTNPFAEAPDITAGRQPQIEAVAKGDLREVLTGIVPHYFPPDDPRPALQALCVEMGLAVGAAAFASQSRALTGRRDQQDTLAAYRGPTLILTGAEDTVCPRDRHERMAALIPGARLAIVAGAGHLPTLERPDATTAEITRWLSQP